MRYIICYGNPVDGYTFVGPFDDRDEAVRYAEVDGEQGTDWCIADLYPQATKEN
jgi:hypothetical protein